MIIILIHGDRNIKLKFNFCKIKKSIKKNLYKKKIFIAFIIKKNFILNFIKINKLNNLIILPIFSNRGNHLKLDIIKIIKYSIKIYVKLKINILKIFLINKNNKKYFLNYYNKKIKNLKKIL